MRTVLPALCLSATTLLAASFWDKKPYQEWSEQEIARILVESPWAKEVIIRFEKEDLVAPPPPAPPPASVAGITGGNPATNLGGGPLGPAVGRKVQTLPSGATVRVRWESALPLRQAIARSKRTELGPPPDAYELVIDNIPPYVESARFGSLQAELLAYTTLKVGKRATLRPSEASISANKAGLVVRLTFPRSTEITAADREVLLETEAGISGIRCEFRLRDMMFAGKLAI